MVNDIVRIEREGEIGLICLSQPPVNALGLALRTAVHEALQELLNEADIKALVLYGEGRFFSAGADIKDFGRAGEKPTLPDVLKALNYSPKPVVAALHGIAFGGALELALAAHVRVGITGLRLALPEVKLGLLPGAGGTQRLPRLTGLDVAVDLICTGRELTGSDALNVGILSRLEEGEARDAGLRAARDALQGTLLTKLTDDQSVTPNTSVLSEARVKFAKGLSAPLRAIDAIEASILPIDEGLAQERALFMGLMQSDERAGLVHAFFAERATMKIPERKATRRDINQIGIVGGGTMGVGIATAVLIAGFPLTLIELQEDHVELAQKNIEANLSGALKRNKLTLEAHAQAIKSLRCSSDLSDLAEVDLVIEAIFEDMSAKVDLFQRLGTICKSGAILATNTSYLDVNAIAAATKRAQDVIGLHFFSPAHIMRLLEVVVADNTAPELVATSFDLARTLKKIPVRSTVCDGFIGNRILTQYRKCADYLLLDGADFDQVDHALEAFGFAMGPFAVSDLAGLDIARAARLRKAATRPEQERYSRVSDLICDEGWYGRKTGRGYYVYDGSKNRVSNPGAQGIVVAERAALGLTARAFSDEEIVARCLSAMIVEAAKVLQEGVALRPVDIDAVKLFGYGFPRHHGGPMHMADQIGLDVLIGRLESYASDDAWFWKQPTILQQMRKAGQSFADLNAAYVDDLR